MRIRSESSEAIQEHRNARADLEKVSQGLQEETDEFLNANQRVIETAQKVSWIRR
jgi:hypothetical protein